MFGEPGVIMKIMQIFMQMQPEIQLLCNTRVIIYRDYSDITVLISPHRTRRRDDETYYE